MQDIKLVVFDFDQTLVNSSKGFVVAFKIIKEQLNSFIENHGYAIDINKHSELLKQIMRNLDAKKQYNRDLWWNILLEKLGVPEIHLSMPESKKLTKLYWNTTAHYTELYPDTLEILNYLKEKHYLLGLLTDTDGSPGLKQIRLKKSIIIEYFDKIMISGDDTPEIKPDPTPFLKLVSHLNVSPENSVMVGDKPFTDIKGGKAAGFHTILLLRSNWTIDPLPDFQIHELIELKSIL